MQLQEIINTDFDVVSANDFAEDAVAQMRRRRKKVLFVYEGSIISGIVLFEDVKTLQRWELQELTVDDLMCRHAIKVPPDIPLMEAARLLRDRPNGCLYMTWNEQPVGIVTRTELLRALEVTGRMTPGLRSREESLPSAPVARTAR